MEKQDSLYGENDTLTHAGFDEEQDNTTIINSSTTIHGNLETQGDVIVAGEIIGNIHAAGNVSVLGHVQGDILCHHAILDHATLEGNIACKGTLEITLGTKLHGNVEAGNLEQGGQIIGDVDVDKAAHFLRSAVIKGNITTSELEIDLGCIINGTIHMLQETDIELS